ncbi:CFS1-like protein [Mycena vitilis]|nr:CFS1-like protein [Mycena vitilis]
MSEQLLDTPAKHPFSFSGLVDSAWHRVSEAAFKTGWAPVARLSEAAVVALMQNISQGRLRVLTYSHIYSFPAPGAPDDSQGFKAELRVLNDAFWIRLCLMSDLGFAEAYMYGDVECDDLVSLFNIFLDNRRSLSGLTSRASYLFTLPQKLTSYRFLNTIGNSRSNISAHYDISNDMFAGFLSQDMTYSCAIFDDLDGDMTDGVVRSEWSGGQGLRRLGQSTAASSSAPAPTEPQSDELYDAQIRKLSHIIDKAKIRPGNRVLEIGSGWGSMAMLIAQTVSGATVDTLTLSVQQQTLAQERIAAAGLTDRITVHLMDYRNMPADWEGMFDRVVSIEMIEAVGSEFLVGYWKTVDWAMKPLGGVGCVQVITIPEARFERYIREIDFIRKWVFPGGFLPTLTLLLQSLQEGSSGRLIVDSVSNIGPHYARTLREWRRRFLYQFDSIIVPALKREYPDVMNGPRGKQEIEVFKRKWIYYYCYCEVGFTSRTLGDHIITFTREGCTDYGCTVYE